MIYTQIPMRHIHRLGGGCPGVNVNVKVRQRSKKKQNISKFQCNNLLTLYNNVCVSEGYSRRLWVQNYFILCTICNLHKLKMADTWNIYIYMYIYILLFSFRAIFHKGSE